MKLLVHATVDVDSDGIVLENQRSRPSFRALDRLPELKDAFERAGYPVTWFIRADLQLESEYGSVAFLFDEYRRDWSSLAASGDEIAWHPHLYRRDADGGFVVDQDGGSCAVQLRAVHAGLKAHDVRCVSVRIGEAFGADSVMRTLDELGLAVDSSAIPGRKRSDRDRSFDWESSPNEPYRPSVSDFRIPGQPSLSILEMPMTTIWMRTAYDPEPRLRYTNPAYHAPIFAEAIDRYLEEVCRRTGDAHLTMIVHPEELQPRADEHGLYAFSDRILAQNLVHLAEAAERRRIDVEALTLSASAERLGRRTKAS